MIEIIKRFIGILSLHIIAIIIGYYMVTFYSQKPYSAWEYHERMVSTAPSIIISMLTISYLFECIIKPKTNDN